MKCAECSDRWKCGAGYDLRRKRRGCEKAKKPAKRSNADRIRKMTDEELATFLDKHLTVVSEYDGNKKHAARLLEWLKEEYKL